ncbi:MAG: CoA transferase [Alphaproteobacteria bacterium]|nr:CoA transferase [Alphaproteobacteria bacterium]
MEPHAPLSGITVVELGHSVAAPFAGQVLADLGATVIKVERPGKGDDARAWGPPFWLGSSATFQSLNRNKLSVVVDFKAPAETTRLADFIAAEADVVLQNMRPGQVARLGLCARLRERNPRLIYCNLGAFGARGPKAERPGYDPLMQAYGGIMSITGEMGRPPVRVGPSIIDIACGMWSVIGILAALGRRHVTGVGCQVDGSLYETALSWMTVPVAMYLADGFVQERLGSEAAILVPYKAYRAADHYLVVAAGNDSLFAKLCAVLEKPEWLRDARFATNPERVRNRAAVNAAVEAVLQTAPRDVWIAKLEAAGIPCAALQSVDQVVADAQTEALGMIQPSPDGAMRLMGLPLSFDGVRPAFRSRPPALGADTARVFGAPSKRAKER